MKASKHWNLTLTDEDGTVLEQWTIGDQCEEGCGEDEMPEHSVYLEETTNLATARNIAIDLLEEITRACNIDK